MHSFESDHENGRPVLQVDRLTKVFQVKGAARLHRERSQFYALNEVSFDVPRGTTFGIVGESGCGKSTLARCIAGLTTPTSGEILLDGERLSSFDHRAMRAARRRLQIVLQDATAALNPRMSVADLVEEPLKIHRIGDATSRRRRVEEVLGLVGVTRAQLDRKPREFSGGQRQRINIARALALQPEVVLLDEPVSAVDVSLQAQILNLLADLQQELGLTYLLIVHDLAVAEHVCDRVAVLYRGEVMELADRWTFFRGPLHPYTNSLLSAVPDPDPRARRRRRVLLRGEVDQRAGVAQGCVFRRRCPVGHDREICACERPPVETRAAGHRVACHFPGALRKDEAGEVALAETSATGSSAGEHRTEGEMG